MPTFRAGFLWNANGGCQSDSQRDSDDETSTDLHDVVHELSHPTPCFEPAHAIDRPGPGTSGCRAGLRVAIAGCTEDIGGVTCRIIHTRTIDSILESDAAIWHSTGIS